MEKYILFAFLNGILIGINRAMNGRLAASIAPMGASFWNHLVGFCFLVILVYLTSTFDFLHTLQEVPLFSYLGGVIGALFVAMNSWVFTRIGATRTILLVIGGQMLGGTILDMATGAIKSVPVQVIGIALIIIGIKIAQRSSQGQSSS